MYQITRHDWAFIGIYVLKIMIDKLKMISSISITIIKECFSNHIRADNSTHRFTKIYMVH